ncbi:36478_t:CDS:2 [Gigaspora margarita]|uniref:36478_t:CDS:1 n=1 Tax=Gigaspora margarita TaxID=4874 RepID=A0ABM8W6L7_GIGMA|nr:36478_t:CDS:2 [Gigaspora margarita]
MEIIPLTLCVSTTLWNCGISGTECNENELMALRDQFQISLSDFAHLHSAATYSHAI